MSVSEVKKKEYLLDEIKKHTSADDCWLIIGNESNGALLDSLLVWALAHGVVECSLPCTMSVYSDSSID